MRMMAQRPRAAARAIAMVGSWRPEVSAVRPSAAASISSTVMGAVLSVSWFSVSILTLLFTFSFRFCGKAWAMSSGLEPMGAHCSVVAS